MKRSALPGIDRFRFGISGESAGAYFAAATALRASDEPIGPKYGFLLLVYPPLDGGGSSWVPCKDHYLEAVDDVRSRYGSPLWVDDLSGMPEAFNIYGQFEISRSESELFIRKLRDSGVATSTFMNRGVGHDVVVWVLICTQN